MTFAHLEGVLDSSDQSDVVLDQLGQEVEVSGRLEVEIDQIC